MQCLLAATATPGVLKAGAFAFGTFVGWNAYFINRYRQTVVIGDLAAIIGAVGGGAVLTLFPAQSVTFGFYGLGLAAGFFAYFVIIIVLVWMSPDATVSWILFGQQGNRPAMADESAKPTATAGDAPIVPPFDVVRIPDVVQHPMSARIDRPIWLPAFRRTDGPDPPL